MSKVEIRQLHDVQEIMDAVYFLPNYSFHASPPLLAKEEFEERVKSRKNVVNFALFEEGESVAVAAATPMTQNVRGKVYDMGGVFGVVTHPNARRKGYSRQVLTEMLKTVREEGKIFTTLYPFRESFYERLGYVSFPQPMKAKFQPPALQPLLKKELPGKIEISLLSESFETFLSYMKDHQSRTHGVGLFNHPETPDPQRDVWLALAKMEGEPVGLMTYSLRGESVTQFKFRAVRFYYHKIEGLYLFLAWIARHIDQANEAEIWLPASEQPNTWLTDLQLEYEPAWLAGMGRVLDVEKISGMETGSGQFSAQVSDPLCPWNEGIWQFESQGGKLAVSRGEKTDCELTIQGLSALVYGTNPPDTFLIRGWGEVPAEVQKTMQDMFPLLKPHLHEYF